MIQNTENIKSPNKNLNNSNPIIKYYTIQKMLSKESLKYKGNFFCKERDNTEE